MIPIEQKALRGIALRQNGMMSLKRPAAGGESCRAGFYFRSSFLRSDELIGAGVVSVVNGREGCFDSFPLQILCATELVQGRIEVTELRIDPA